MLMNRRDILKLILSTSAMAAGWSITGAQAATKPTSPLPFQKNMPAKSLVTLGGAIHRHPAAIFGESKIVNKYGLRNCSVLSELNLKTETLKQSVVPVAMAHGALRLKNGNLLITAHHRKTSALLDESHQPINVFDAPENYVFGGHATVFPEKNIVVIPVRHAHPTSKKDTGRLLVHDADNFKLLEEYDSGGIHPHEIRLLPERDEFVITHYGDITSDDPEGFMFNVLEPKLSVLDSNSFATKREYIQPMDAIYTHMDVGQSSNIYAISNQYIRYRDKTGDELKALLKKYNFKHEEALTYIEEVKNKMAVPLGIIRMDPVTGDREVFLSSKKDFLRSQSITAHTKSGRIFATYSNSNNLIVIDEKTKKITIKNAYDYGFHVLRGVTNIPGTDYIAISDRDHGIAIVNAITLEKVKEFPVSILSSPHIFAI